MKLALPVLRRRVLPLARGELTRCMPLSRVQEPGRNTKVLLRVNDVGVTY